MGPSPGSLHWRSAQQSQNLRPLCQTDRADGDPKCQKEFRVSTCCQSGQVGWPGGLVSCRWRRKVSSGNLKCQKELRVSTCCQSGQIGWPGGLVSCRWRRKVPSSNLKCQKELRVSTLFSAIETHSHSRHTPAPFCCSLLLLPSAVSTSRC